MPKKYSSIDTFPTARGGREKALPLGFSVTEWGSWGNDWLILAIGQLRHEFSWRGWKVAGLWSWQRAAQILRCVWGLALADGPSLNPFRGTLGHNTQRSDHWTYGAVQILPGHRGPILTEPRLCRQSHSTWWIFRGNRSINSWLHNWFTATEKKHRGKGIFFLLFLCTGAFSRARNSGNIMR